MQRATTVYRENEILKRSTLEHSLFCGVRREIFLKTRRFLAPLGSRRLERYFIDVARTRFG